jgi:hypothetical protein
MRLWCCCGGGLLLLGLQAAAAGCCFCYGLWHWSGWIVVIVVRWRMWCMMRRRLWLHNISVLLTAPNFRSIGVGVASGVHAQFQQRVTELSILLNRIMMMMLMTCLDLDKGNLVSSVSATR